MYLLSLNRHVKGIVLVALADGTLAIFHRGVGKHSVRSWNREVIIVLFERNMPFVNSVLKKGLPTSVLQIVLRNHSYFSCNLKSDVDIQYFNQA